MDPGFQVALARATSLLALRARSRRELSDRLTGAGYPPLVIEQVDRHLSELGLLDDREFALERVRHLLESGRSSPAIRGDAVLSRVPADLVEDALEEVGTDEGERAVALAMHRASACTHLPANKAVARVARYLGSRGYEPDVVQDACRRVFGPREDD